MRFDRRDPPKSDAKSDEAHVRTGAHGAVIRKIAFLGSLAQRRHVQSVAPRCARVRTPRKMEPGGIESPGRFAFCLENKALPRSAKSG